jgi:hypothetical protein
VGESARLGKNPLLWLGVVTFVALVVLCTVDIWHLVSLDKQPPEHPELTLTGAIMAGLALVVGLMILLLLFYKITGVEDKTQALGLPSGSVRALIAFCLVLMFVSMGVFLYQGVSAPALGRTASNQTQKDVEYLKAHFDSVIAQPALIVDGKPAPADNPLYNVTYYPTSKDAVDFAKQMFAQLATVFVTVIGFYFGSSTAAAGVGTGVAAAGGSAGKNPTAGSTVPGALQEAKSLASDADADLKRAQSALDTLQKATPQAEVKVMAAQAAVNGAKTAVDSIHTALDTAIAAGAKYGTAPTDAENAAAAADVIKARDTIKQLAGAVKADADKTQALLK